MRRILLRRLDEWAHYHRFEWRWLCDAHEVARGTPRGALHREHRIAALRAHEVGRSYRAHPSHTEQPAEHT